jgi:hypothetical protein
MESQSRPVNQRTAKSSSWSDVGRAREEIAERLQLGVTTGLASSSVPHFAIESLIFVLHVVFPEGIPISVEICPSQIEHRLCA